MERSKININRLQTIPRIVAINACLLRNATSRTMFLLHLKLICTIIILTADYKFLKFFMSVVLTIFSSFYRVFKLYFITLCFVLVLYCGTPVLRMRDAIANDMI